MGMARQAALLLRERSEGGRRQRRRIQQNLARSEARAARYQRRKYERAVITLNRETKCPSRNAINQTGAMARLLKRNLRMRWNLPARIALAALIAATSLSTYAHPKATPPPITAENEIYVRPFPPLRIVGNVYYVGTYDLAVYLIVTPAGSMLINTGVNDSV